MKIRFLFPALLVCATATTLFVSDTVAAQTVSTSAAQPIFGEWRADTPLPNGVVQTFRFDSAGSFDLSRTLVVDGSYRVEQNRLIETVTLPSVGTSHTDTATFVIAGDSLVVSESGTSAARVLHRSGAAGRSSDGQSIVGDWAIQVGGQIAAHYTFNADGSMHVHASVGDERGSYTIRADTLHLSNDQTFQLPATARFTVADSVLTLTPPNGKQPRQFHKVTLH
jgi:hypothetical protein